MNNKKAIEELTIDQVINVLCVDLENLQVKQNHFGVQNTRKVRIQAYKKAIEVLKHFDGAVEVVSIESLDPNDGCPYAYLGEDKEQTRLENYKLYAIPKEQD